LVSTLKEISENPYVITQGMIDELCTLVVAQIGVKQATRANKPKRTKGPNYQTGRKRKRKRFRYARTQDLFRKNPNLLARYIREGTPWLEDEDSSSPKPEDVKSFYTALWGTLPEIKIPFTVNGSGHIARDIGDVIQAIISLDINERLHHTRQNTAPGRTVYKGSIFQDLQLKKS
jgi:hypothetical protein